ncbi:WG repeat-containing protein [bacterium]|nr:WG repeat-containing protein [bacterium]
MKKLTYLFLTFLFMAQIHAAQIYTSGNLSGLKDDAGNIIVKAQYQKITQLQYTPIKTILIPMQSTKEVKAVVLDSYKVQKDGLWGVIDNTGKVICAPKYDDIKVNEYGEIITVKGGIENALNPVKNSMKKTSKTVESIVGLPVTIVAGALMPVEVISKIGKK